MSFVYPHPPTHTHPHTHKTDLCLYAHTHLCVHTHRDAHRNMHAHSHKHKHTHSFSTLTHTLWFSLLLTHTRTLARTLAVSPVLMKLFISYVFDVKERLITCTLSFSFRRRNTSYAISHDVSPCRSILRDCRYVCVNVCVCVCVRARPYERARAVVAAWENSTTCPEFQISCAHTQHAPEHRDTSCTTVMRLRDVR